MDDCVKLINGTYLTPAELFSRIGLNNAGDSVTNRKKESVKNQQVREQKEEEERIRQEEEEERQEKQLAAVRLHKQEKERQQEEVRLRTQKEQEERARRELQNKKASQELENKRIQEEQERRQEQEKSDAEEDERVESKKQQLEEQRTALAREKRKKEEELQESEDDDVLAQPHNHRISAPSPTQPTQKQQQSHLNNKFKFELPEGCRLSQDGGVVFPYLKSSDGPAFKCALDGLSYLVEDLDLGVLKLAVAYSTAKEMLTIKVYEARGLTPMHKDGDVKLCRRFFICKIFHYFISHLLTYIS
jgi:hypothetical protein